MPDQNNHKQPESRPTPLGIYERPNRGRVTAVEIVALIVSVIWLCGAAVFFLVLGNDEPQTPETTTQGSLRFIMTMMAIFLPVAMIWVAATAARASKVMRDESQRLQSAIDAIRQAYISQSHSHGGGAPSVSRKLDEIAAAQRKTETALATFHTTRSGPAEMPKLSDSDPDEPKNQVALPLGTRTEDITPPLATADFIRAMNFPETADDVDGFAALRRALKDRSAKQLVQASQDLLTLLSQDGIYMDDLRPDMARPEIWRRFAAGERGRQVAALGGVRDRSCLALTAGRMRNDPIFRDAAHHFLRKFDQVFTEFADRATDAELSEMADTRTARAFMLLGRVTGTFD